MLCGRYFLDSCGNCFQADGFIAAEHFPDTPNMMTSDEFRSFIKEKFEGNERQPYYSFSSNYGLPSTKVICPECQKGWDISNCYDTIVRYDYQTIPLGNLTGQKLGTVRFIFAKRTDAIYYMQEDRLIRNDRFIDLSLKYPDPEDEWQKNIVKNEDGWASKKDEIDDDYIIRPTDEGFFNVLTFYHHACNRQNLHRFYENCFREVFEEAGFGNIEMTVVRNEYCSCSYCDPWFEISTELGIVKIGWRKRVINIDCSSIIKNGAKLNLEKLFTKEDVTKDNDYIHAWGYEKATEYLRQIRDFLTGA
ncbi:MAG TPA: hypothetical protein P5096_01670 [Patescibacteria group bacterium]|nr:hypothetical protein [Patescibacteria group bacterium]